MKKLARWANQNLRLLFSVLFLLFALLLLLGTFFQIKDDQVWNRLAVRSMEDFNPDLNPNEGSNQYLDKIPMEQMDLTRLSFTVDGMVGLYPPERYSTWRLTRELTYYREANGQKVPAFTVRKGTVVAWPWHTVYGGYGFYTFPTYEEGWRYGVPFVTAQELSRWKRELEVLPPEEFPYYYVKLEDLRTVSNAMMRALGEKRGLSNREMKIWLLSFDRSLADYDVYISADLRASISPAQYLPNYTAAALCLLAALLLFRVQLKHSH